MRVYLMLLGRQRNGFKRLKHLAAYMRGFRDRDMHWELHSLTGARGSCRRKGERKVEISREAPRSTWSGPLQDPECHRRIGQLPRLGSREFPSGKAQRKS